MTAPERIWIDALGGNWSPQAGGTQGIEYIRADLAAVQPAQVQPDPRDEVIKKLVGAVHNCVGMLDQLVAESGRLVEWDAEDPFRMGEWFEPEDLAQIESARAALAAAKAVQHG